MTLVTPTSQMRRGQISPMGKTTPPPVRATALDGAAPRAHSHNTMAYGKPTTCQAQRRALGRPCPTAGAVDLQQVVGAMCVVIRAVTRQRGCRTKTIILLESSGVVEAKSWGPDHLLLIIELTLTS